MPESLITHLKTLGLKDDVSEAEVAAFIKQQISDGKLTPEKFMELAGKTPPPAAPKADDSAKSAEKVKELIAGGVAAAMAGVGDSIAKSVAEAVKAAMQAAPKADGQDAVKQLADAIAAQTKPKDSDPALIAAVKSLFAGGDGATIGGGQKTDHIRLKSAAERYDDTKAVVIHRDKSFPGSSRDVFVGGRKAYSPSDLDMVICGVYLKAKCAGRFGYRLNEHERDLLAYAVHERKWSGMYGGQEFAAEYLPEHVKAPLVSDSTSGGQEMIPDAFDSALITKALLFGELLPYVQIVNIPKGRLVEGASIGNPTLTWNVAEGTAITTLDATSLVSAFDNTIFPVSGAVEIGNWLMEDSPMQVAAQMIENYGNVFQKELDKVIAIGDGTTQPQGLKNASGTTAVNSVSNTPGPIKVDDAYTLFFGVPKQYRKEPGFSFVMTDTEFKRFVTISVTATDQRRVFPMDPGLYKMLEVPVRINNDLSNGMLFAGPLSRYRLYRRQGMEVRVTSEGKSLALAQTTLVVVTGRFAGKLTQGESFAKMADGDI